MQISLHPVSDKLKENLHLLHSLNQNKDLSSLNLEFFFFYLRDTNETKVKALQSEEITQCTVKTFLRTLCIICTRPQ